VARTAKQRFMAKVDKHGPYTGLVAGRCYDWTGAKAKGYGRFWFEGRLVYAHRFAYGDMPDGLELNHLCLRKLCVRRSHLEVSTHRNNIRYSVSGQQNDCVHGHALSNDNLYVDPRGHWHCRTCGRASALRYYHRRVKKERQAA